MKLVSLRINAICKKTYIVFLCCILSTLSYAQCPASISTTAPTIVTATCPSNGGFTINDNSGPSGARYQIMSGPAGFPPTAQSSNVFSSLLSGDYTVKISCAFDNNISTTQNLNIPSTYVQLDANSTVSVCSPSGSGGTISTTVTAGNSTPFTYAYWQGDINAADNTLTYGATNTYVASSFGNYNARVKDACGVFVSQILTVQNTYPTITISSVTPSLPSNVCPKDNSNIYFTLQGVAANSYPPQGIDVNIYAVTGNCVRGAFINTTHLDQSNSNTVTGPNLQNLIFEVVTPCGDKSTFCYTYDPNYFNASI